MIAPQFVKPYVKSNKNDANDAEAVCEAMSRPRIAISKGVFEVLQRVRAGDATL